MRCHICNTALGEVHFNRDADEFEPCGTCLEVIKDTLEGYLDKAAADEEDFGYEPPSVLVGAVIDTGASAYEDWNYFKEL